MMQHNYLLLTYNYGGGVAINCKILKTERIKNSLEKNYNNLSIFSGFVSCSFQEYLSNKVPFIES